MDKKPTLRDLINKKDWAGIQRDHFPTATLKEIQETFKTLGNLNDGPGLLDKVKGIITSLNPTNLFATALAIVGVIKGGGDAITKAFNNFADGLSGTVKQNIFDIKQIFSDSLDDLAHFRIGNLLSKAITIPVDVATQATSNVFATEGLGRDTINRDLGMTGELAANFRQTLIDAYAETILIGAEFEDIQSIVKGVSEGLNTSRLMSAKTIQDIFETQKALGVSQDTIQQSAAAFEDVSVGLSSIPKQLTTAGNFARSVGLNVRKYTEVLVANMSLLNQYGFKNGIEGLQRMISKAQSLRMEMSTVTNLVEKVFNPEGAIEMAAQLQAVGGAFGSFADPLKLVYQATNDMEGLQDSLIQSAASLATFNRESGRFEITALNMRKAKVMADAMGMTYQDLTNLAVRAAQKADVASKLRIMGFDPKTEEFLKNMAEMKDGRMVISVNDSIGKSLGSAYKDGVVELGQLSGKQLESLQEQMEAYQREANKTPQQIALDQLMELKTLNNLMNQALFKTGRQIYRSGPITETREHLKKMASYENVTAADKNVDRIVSSLKSLESIPTFISDLTGIVKDVITAKNAIEITVTATGPGTTSATVPATIKTPYPALPSDEKRIPKLPESNFPPPPEQKVIVKDKLPKIEEKKDIKKYPKLPSSFNDKLLITSMLNEVIQVKEILEKKPAVNTVIRPSEVKEIEKKEPNKVVSEKEVKINPNVTVKATVSQEKKESEKQSVKAAKAEEKKPTSDTKTTVYVKEEKQHTTTNTTEKKEEKVKKLDPIILRETRPTSLDRIHKDVSTTLRPSKEEKKENQTGKPKASVAPTSVPTQIEKTIVQPHIIDRVPKVPITHLNRNEVTVTNTTNTVNETNRTIAEKSTEMKHKVDINITSNQTLYDEMSRKLMRDPEFLSVLTENIINTMKKIR